MSYTILDDEKLVRMYEEEMPMSDIRKEFGTTNGTIYRHLVKKGIKPNRKQSIPWTDEEERQLIKARKEGHTGRELYNYIPTREPNAIKSHIQKLRLLKIIR